MRLKSYRDVKKKTKKDFNKVEIDFSSIIDVSGGSQKTVKPKDDFFFNGLSLKYVDSGNSDTMKHMDKSQLILRATFFRDEDFYIGRLTDYPEIFTHDDDLEKLKQGLIDSMSIYYNIDLDRIHTTVTIHEDPDLQKAFN